VAAPGDVTFSPGPLTILQTYLVNGVDKLIDSLHMRNGGTSIASPSVAGTAALLLEKCPMPGPTEILEALTASAFGDAYATNLPNPRFGHGKLNAFQALVHTNFPVAINGEAGACPGDSSLLAAPPGMLDYAWNDGSTLAEHWAQPGDSLWLTVHDQAGCLSMSDTLVMQPTTRRPVAEIAVDGLELQFQPWPPCINGIMRGKPYRAPTAPAGRPRPTRQLLRARVGQLGLHREFRYRVGAAA
jgi:hypothetical protein